MSLVRPSLLGAALGVIVIMAAASCSAFSDFSLRGEEPVDARVVVIPEAATDVGVDAGLCASYAADAARYHIFVSSKGYPGNFAAEVPVPSDGGLADAQAVLAVADRICASHGAKVNPCARWEAVISADDRAPTARVRAVADGFFVVVAGDTPTIEQRVFDGGIPLLGNPTSSIDRDELGNRVPDGGVWTGAQPPVGFGKDCQRWTASGGSFPRGTVGRVGATDAGWLLNDVESCSTSQHLYCVEQPP